ncbi:MAG TPA: anhydro-N-acetylmuramic acid kinase [Ignavibacteria bacterium]|nr:anhydro-N-acetylmuramic acid kinase [Ignavibacteria bacterium]
MNILKGIVNKSRRKVIGILSGTSIDAVDVVLTEIYGSGIESEIRILEFDSFPIDKKVRNLILRCSSEKTGNTADICKLNFIIGRLFGIKINEFLKKNKISPNEIDLTGSHGQTIFHYPVKNNQYGYDSKSTMQIGDLSVIANITGVTTIGDFRTADVSVNGDGAPLVPYLDYILSRKINCSSVFLNIGGISNITYIKKNCKLNEVIAFDTGPGNLLIDLISKKYFNKKFDKDGKIAGKGNIDSSLLEKIVTKDKFVKKPSPKSTGREYYNEEFIESIVKKNSYDPYDLMATFNFFTAYAVNYNIKKFKTDKIFVSGGGSNNLTLMKNLRNLFEGTDLEILNLNGINSSNKEAVLFAVLANELISGNKTNIISVTGADKNVFLGKICIA